MDHPSNAAGAELHGEEGALSLQHVAQCRQETPQTHAHYGPVRAQRKQVSGVSKSNHFMSDTALLL